MENTGYLSKILRSPQTVFSFQDVISLWGEDATNAARVRVNYYVKNGELYPIRRGIYAKDKNYDKYEAGNKIYTPSYIGFETVLSRSGVLLRHFNQVFLASYLSREITADDQVYVYRKIKDSVLNNDSGVEHRFLYSIATPERAFLDLVYISGEHHFENLSALNWEKVFSLLPIFDSSDLEKRIRKYYEQFQSSE